MKLVIITHPDFFDGETALVNRLFRLGMERLHLRKPKSTEQELAEWLDQIDAAFLPRIVLHDHHVLALHYPLGGIHLNGRNPVALISPSSSLTPQPSSLAPQPSHLTISRSCHSLAEVERYKAECDYLFLSPIYDSISKEGYGAAFSREVIDMARQQGIIDEKVFALGGVSVDRLLEIKIMGFGGAAMLGDVWQAKSPEDKFVEIEGILSRM